MSQHTGGEGQVCRAAFAATPYPRKIAISEIASSGSISSADRLKAVCTNFTPTKRSQWVKDKLGVDLPTGFPDESYPSFAAPLVVKSHQTGRVACGLARLA